MRVYVHTWGCQLNEHKSEAIAGVLTDAGYQLVERLADADVVIFNTCAVRERAVEKVLGRISEVKGLRRRGKRVLLGIGGCVPQARKEREELIDRTDQIDFLFGSSDADIARLPEIIARAERSPERPLITVGEPDDFAVLPLVRRSPFRAYVTISEGCDHFCSYCIVPYTRGRLRSRPLDEIVHEVEELVAQNYQEVTLLGQNVNAYGVDLFGEGRFAELLRRVAATGIPRIRFTSSHPEDMTREILETIAELPNVCEHIHMAAQSGSNRVLRDMRRPYTKEQFLAKVAEAKRIIPGVNITTDLIVGYPTETEEDFQETVDLVKRARFGSAYIFKFSPRPGTVAALKYGDPIPDEVKQRRHRELLELQKRISREESEKLVGRTVAVLVEGRGAQGLFGRSCDHRLVLFPGPEEWVSRIVAVEITAAVGGELHGVPLGEAAGAIKTEKLEEAREALEGTR